MGDYPKLCNQFSFGRVFYCVTQDGLLDEDDIRIISESLLEEIDRKRKKAEVLPHEEARVVDEFRGHLFASTYRQFKDIVEGKNSWVLATDGAKERLESFDYLLPFRMAYEEKRWQHFHEIKTMLYEDVINPTMFRYCRVLIAAISLGGSEVIASYLSNYTDESTSLQKAFPST